MSGSEKKQTLTLWADFTDSVGRDFWKHDSKDCPGREEVEFGGEWNASIEIKNGVVSFEFEGEYEGPSLYFQEILLYDLCALGALYQEVKEDRA